MLAERLKIFDAKSNLFTHPLPSTPKMTGRSSSVGRAHVSFFFYIDGQGGGGEPLAASLRQIYLLFIFVHITTSLGW